MLKVNLFFDESVKNNDPIKIMESKIKVHIIRIYIIKNI